VVSPRAVFIPPRLLRLARETRLFAGVMRNEAKLEMEEDDEGDAVPAGVEATELVLELL
jgi:hypothetical protein